ncbi:MAG TPA: hypothetical protein VGF85_02000 [Opitutaceae bacterium]|jgi:hypothetical protein
MKPLTALVVLASAVLLAACNSGVEDSVRSALAPREAFRSRVFQGDQKAVYEAARMAGDSMGYHYVKGGPAQGELTEMTGITEGEEVGSSRQIVLRAHLEPDVEGSTSISVTFNEILEPASTGQPGFATETPMRDTPLYEVFFRKVQDALLNPGKKSLP